MTLSRPFILRPIATSMLMFAVLLIGLIGLKRLPVSALPEVDYPTIQVQTGYPGASPEIVEATISAPLEKQLGQISGLQQMSSSSSFGLSSITLKFNLNLDIDVAEQQVQSAINTAYTYLPADLPTPPQYSKRNPADAPVLTLALSSRTLPLLKVHDLADTRLAQKIAQLSGVGLVDLAGGLKPAIHVRVNPTALAALGLSLEDIRMQLAQSSVNQPKGNFDGPFIALTLQANDQLMTLEDFRQQIIAYRNQAPIRLKDVAEITEEPENRRLRSWVNGEPAIILDIHRQPGANTLRLVEHIQELLPELEASLPGDIDIQVVADRTLTTRASIQNIRNELLVTIALVVLVIFIFLRNLPATLIPSLSIPLSLAGTFGAMYTLGYSLNNLTLMALTIATGFVVDDAIVMLENIIRFMERGKTPRDAALKGAEEIGFTILSLTASLLAVLIPLLFMGDVLGRLFREFAVTLSLAILVSAFVSLTLTPMLAAMLPARHGKASRREPETSDWMGQLTQAYGRALQWTLDRNSLVIGTAASLVGLTLVLVYGVPKGFFPPQDTGILLGLTEAHPSIAFESMAERQAIVNQQILKDPAVASLSAHVGVDGTNTTISQGRMLISLKPKAERGPIGPVLERLTALSAETKGLSLLLQPVQDLTIEDRVSPGQYQFTIEAPEPRLLETWDRRILDALSLQAELKDPRSNLDLGAQALRLDIDRDTAGRLGVPPQLITQTLYDAYGQRQIINRYTQTNQYRVILELQGAYQARPDSLENLYLPAADGKTIPLMNLLKVSSEEGPLSIHRQSQFPTVTYSFNLAPGIALGTGVAAARQALSTLSLPESLRVEFQGTAKAFNEALGNQMVLLLAAIVAVYIILGILYESFIHPITILSTLPSAAVGALLMLGVLGIDLDIISLIGIVLLIGIVAKNAIMMIDFALNLQRSSDLTAKDAIQQAALLRFRPILMTTLAALLAGVPLALGGGVGAEMHRPLGVVIIGGLLFSQVLTLFTTPSIYVGFDRLARRYVGAKVEPTPRINGSDPP